MEIVDIVLLSIIACFGAVGVAVGFVHAVSSLLGVVFGIYLATRFYVPVVDWLISLIGHESNFARVFIFVIAFVLITKLVGLVFLLLEKVFHLIKFIPFVKTINRLLGLVFGLAEGVITIGMVIFFIDKVPLSEKLMAGLSSSVVATYTLKVASILWPLLPQALKILESTVDAWIKL